MRILFLNYEYPPLGGGAANATAYLLKEYQAHPDLEVDLITSSATAQQTRLSLNERITVHALPIGKNGHNLHHQSQKDLVVYSWKAYRYSRALLREKKYDVIHAFFGVPCGVIALALGRRFDIPYIVSLRGADVPGYSERFSSLYVFLRPLIRIVWKKALAVVSNSQGLKELALQSAPQQEIRVIPNGVDTQIFYPDITQRPREEWIITAGATRLTQRKGLHLVIEALPKLLHESKKVVFEVMGDGASLEFLQKRAVELGVAERVRFLGRIPAAETYRYYQRASVFVLPSANEGMSNALLEALASGLPAIVTDTGGSAELVTEGENGYVIERTSEALLRGLTKLLQDDTRCAQMSKASRQKAEAQSWSQVALDYQALYNQAYDI